MKSLSTSKALFFLLFILLGCADDSPVASFTIDKSIVEVGETVSFSNLSENATEYIWDFGDGNASAELSPTHIYEQAGTYTIKLSSFGNKSNDLTTGLIEVVPAFVNIEARVRVGDYYLNDDLKTHFDKLDESRMEYSSFLTLQGNYQHEFVFDYAGIRFVLYTPTESYSINEEATAIEVYPPFDGQTKGRISFGSSFNDVSNAFGTVFTSTPEGHRFYQGIIFWADTSEPIVKSITIN